MNKQLYSICLVIAALLPGVQSCYVDLNNDGFGCESGKGPMITESRGLPAFNSVVNAIGADVILRQDSDQEFNITAPENLLDDITTRVIDGELIIDYRGCYRNADIDIFISNPDITGVHNIGSGNVTGDNVWQTDRLALTITGSGYIDAEFLADRVDAEITGSGNMDLFGEVERSFIRVSGSGDIYAFNLESSNQDIRISGSGNCEVFARDILDVLISGSGNVFYRGNPLITTNISGSGSVIESN